MFSAITNKFVQAIGTIGTLGTVGTVGAMVLTASVGALVVSQYGIPNQGGGGGNDGVGTDWYYSVQDASSYSPQRTYPLPGRINGVTLLIQPEVSGTAQDVKGTYSLLYNQLTNRLEGSGVNANGNNQVRLTMERVGNTYMLTVYSASGYGVGPNANPWHGSTVLYHDNGNNARRLYFRLGGNTGTVKVSGVYN